MAFSPTDFEHETEYERFVLGATYPLIARPATGVTIDATQKGHRSIKIGLPPFETQCEFPPFGGVGSREDGKSVEFDIRPLIFGAGWKVLDLLVESTINHLPGKHRQVKDKLAKLSSEPAPVPFYGEADLWDRTVALYSELAEMRNCVVHRRFWIDDQAEVMRGAAKDPGATPPRPVSLDEQAAFCRIAQGVANSVIAQELTARERRQLQCMFDVLRDHHGLGDLGGSVVEGPIPTVKASLDRADSGDFYLDGPYIHQQARAGAPNASAFDLLIVLPGGRSLLGELDALPSDGVTPIDLDNPPAWLRWQ